MIPGTHRRFLGLIDRSRNSPRQRPRVEASVTFPDREYLVSSSPQPPNHPLVPLAVRNELRQPEFTIPSRNGSADTAVMVMPKTPMDVDRPSLGPIGNIRRTR